MTAEAPVISPGISGRPNLHRECTVQVGEASAHWPSSAWPFILKAHSSVGRRCMPPAALGTHCTAQFP